MSTATTPPDGLRAATVPARVRLLLAAQHGRDDPALSSAAVAEQIATQTGVTVPVAVLEQVRGGDATRISAEQLAALAETFDCPGEYFTDPTVAEDLASRFDLARTLRDTGTHIGCAGRGGDMTATSAGRDQLRDILRRVEEHGPAAFDGPLPGDDEPPVRRQRDPARQARMRVAPEDLPDDSPKPSLWQRLTRRRPQ